MNPVSQAELTEDRKRLMLLGAQVLVAMGQALREPKNLAKGDVWREMGWTELGDELEGEAREMREDAMLGDRERAMREAGDVLAVAVMQLDKMGGR